MEARSTCCQADLAATAVARQWLLWMPPMVITLSCPLSLASAIRNSSLRTCSSDRYMVLRCRHWCTRLGEVAEPTCDCYETVIAMHARAISLLGWHWRAVCAACMPWGIYLIARQLHACEVIALDEHAHRLRETTRLPRMNWCRKGCQLHLSVRHLVTQQQCLPAQQLRVLLTLHVALPTFDRDPVHSGAAYCSIW